MNLTPLAFLSLAERLLQEALPSARDRQWRFQRFINITARSGSLQILSERPGGDPEIAGILNVRITAGPQDSIFQGSLHSAGEENNIPFSLRESSEAQLEEGIRRAITAWVGHFPKVEGPPVPVLEPPPTPEPLHEPEIPPTLEAPLEPEPLLEPQAPQMEDSPEPPPAKKRGKTSKSSADPATSEQTPPKSRAKR